MFQTWIWFRNDVSSNFWRYNTKRSHNLVCTPDLAREVWYKLHLLWFVTRSCGKCSRVCGCRVGYIEPQGHHRTIGVDGNQGKMFMHVASVLHTKINCNCMPFWSIDIHILDFQGFIITIFRKLQRSHKSPIVGDTNLNILTIIPVIII